MVQFFRQSAKGVSVVEYGLVAALVVLAIIGVMVTPNAIGQFFAGTVNSADGSLIPSMGTSVVTGTGQSATTADASDLLDDDETPSPSGGNNNPPPNSTELCAILSIACGSNDVIEVAASLGSDELVQMMDAIIALMNEMDLPPESQPFLSEVMALANIGHTIAGGIAEIEASCPNNVCAGMPAASGTNFFNSTVNSLFGGGDQAALLAFLDQYITVSDMYLAPGDYGMSGTPIPPEYQSLFQEIITIATYNIEHIVSTIESEMSYNGNAPDLGDASSMTIHLNANNICATSGSMACLSP